jgi:hypothetical protein
MRRAAAIAGRDFGINSALTSFNAEAPRQLEGTQVDSATLAAAEKDASLAYQLLGELCRQPSAAFRDRLDFALSSLQLAEYRSALTAEMTAPSQAATATAHPDNAQLITTSSLLLKELLSLEPGNQRALYGLARCTWWHAVEAEKINQHETAHQGFQQAIEGTIQAIDASDVRRPELLLELAQMLNAMARIERRREHPASIEAARGDVLTCFEKTHGRGLLNNDELKVLRRQIEETINDRED